MLSMVLHVGIYHAHDVLGKVQHEHNRDIASDHNHNNQSDPVKADATHCIAGLIHLTTGEIIQPLSNDIVVVEYLYSYQDHYSTDPSSLGQFGRAPPVEMI